VHYKILDLETLGAAFLMVTGVIYLLTPDVAANPELFLRHIDLGLRQLLLMSEALDIVAELLRLLIDYKAASTLGSWQHVDGLVTVWVLTPPLELRESSWVWLVVGVVLLAHEALLVVD
jgi:hypothetical protein